MNKHVRQSRSEFQPVKSVRTVSTVSWIFLLMVGLITALSPRPVAAQDERFDLTLTLVPGGYRLKPGSDNILFLEIRNTGSEPITDIRLSSVKPEGWVIDLKPDKMDDLAPGSFQTIEVNIKPPAKTAERDHDLTIVAQTNEITRVRRTRVRVERPQGSWLWIGGIVVLVAVAGFAVIFVRLEKH